jgi:hypothetical protein
MIEILDGDMTLVVGGDVVATARFSPYAAADGNGAWTVSTHPSRPFTRNQAKTGLMLTECLAVGYGDDNPFVRSWRAELFL